MNKEIKENWENKLIDLIEEEIELASGVKSKEHFSQDCRMNDCLDLVRKTLANQRQELKKKIAEGLPKRIDDERKMLPLEELKLMKEIFSPAKIMNALNNQRNGYNQYRQEVKTFINQLLK